MPAKMELVRIDAHAGANPETRLCHSVAKGKQDKHSHKQIYLFPDSGNLSHSIELLLLKALPNQAEYVSAKFEQIAAAVHLSNIIIRIDRRSQSDNLLVFAVTANPPFETPRERDSLRDQFLRTVIQNSQSGPPARALYASPAPDSTKHIKVRELLRSGQQPPLEVIRPEVADVLIQALSDERLEQDASLAKDI
jgi:hypothetical protein